MDERRMQDSVFAQASVQVQLMKSGKHWTFFHTELTKEEMALALLMDYCAIPSPFTLTLIFKIYLFYILNFK